MSGPQDVGLQAERTALAWNRTGLAVLVNGLLVLRTGWSARSFTLAALGALLLIAAGGGIAYGAWRRRELLAPTGARAPAPAVVGVTAAVGVLAGLAGLGSIVFGR